VDFFTPSPSFSPLFFPSPSYFSFSTSNSLNSSPPSFSSYLFGFSGFLQCDSRLSSTQLAVLVPAPFFFTKLDSPSPHLRKNKFVFSARLLSCCTLPLCSLFSSNLLLDPKGIGKSSARDPSTLFCLSSPCSSDSRREIIPFVSLSYASFEPTSPVGSLSLRLLPPLRGNTL